MTIKNVII